MVEKEKILTTIKAMTNDGIHELFRCTSRTTSSETKRACALKQRYNCFIEQQTKIFPYYTQ